MFIPRQASDYLAGVQENLRGVVGATDSGLDLPEFDLTFPLS